MYENILVKNHLGEPEYELGKDFMSEHDYETFPKTEWISKKQWEDFIAQADDIYWWNWWEFVEAMFGMRMDKNDVKGDTSELLNKYKEGLDKMKRDDLNEDSTQKEICDSFSKRYNK